MHHFKVTIIFPGIKFGSDRLIYFIKAVQYNSCSIAVNIRISECWLLNQLIFYNITIFILIKLIKITMPTLKN